MVIIAQLVRASDCGSEGRGFESHWSPQGSLVLSLLHVLAAFYLISFVYNVFEVANTLVLATFFLVWGGEEGVFVWHHNVALRSRECVVGKKIFTIFAPYCCLIDYERFRSLASLLCACRLMLLEAVSLAGRVRRRYRG